MDRLGPGLQPALVDLWAPLAGWGLLPLLPQSWGPQESYRLLKGSCDEKYY